MCIRDRAYLIADGSTYYSQQITFSIGAKNYGTVTIKNNGGNTFLSLIHI